MPAPPLSNNYEGGTDGVTLTTGNTGGASGDAFNSITGAVTFSNVQARGTISQRIVDQTITTHSRWQTLGNITTNIFARCYIWISAIPTGARAGFSGYQDSGGLTAGSVRINTTTGFMEGGLASGSSAAGSIGSVQVPVGAWFRVEYRVLPSTTVGEIEWKWWSNPDSGGTPDDTVKATGLVLAASVDRIYFGLQATNPTTPFTIYHDEVAVSTWDWIGTDPPKASSPLFIPHRMPAGV